MIYLGLAAFQAKNAIDWSGIVYNKPLREARWFRFGNYQLTVCLVNREHLGSPDTDPIRFILIGLVLNAWLQWKGSTLPQSHA